MLVVISSFLHLTKRHLLSTNYVLGHVLVMGAWGEFKRFLSLQELAPGGGSQQERMQPPHVSAAGSLQGPPGGMARGYFQQMKTKLNPETRDGRTSSSHLFSEMPIVD